MPGALLGVVGEGRVVLLEPGLLVAMGLEVSKREAVGNRLDRNGQRDAQQLQHADDGAPRVLARLGPRVHQSTDFVDSSRFAEQVVVEVAAAHLDGGVLVAVGHGVLSEGAILVVEPVLRAPAVHDDATAAFVNGFASEEGFGAVEQTQDIESLLRARAR